ncbi:MAG: ABC transporter permease [Vicinamibacteria bacterium]
MKIGPFSSEKRNDELDEELCAHVAMAARDLEERGLSHEDAFSRARREFGNETAIREATKDVWGQRIAEDLAQDLRYGFRGLRRNPGFTFVVLFSFAIGIGANAAIFTLVDATLNRPLPFPDSHRLVVLTDENVEKGRMGQGVSPGNLIDWRADNGVFSGLAGSYARSVVVSEEENSEIVIGAQATEDFFTVHGVRPTIGRTFSPEELEAGMTERVGGSDAGPVVIGERLWRRRFSASPDVIGRTLSLDGITRRVIGVMPASFIASGAEAELWLPWNVKRAYPRLKSVPRDFRFLRAVGRLNAGVTMAAAQERFTTLAATQAHDYPDANAGWTVHLSPLREAIVGETRSTLLALFGAVGLVLLLMSANVASLQMARGAAREREMAVRQAIGVTRPRLIRQLLTEALTLSFMGSALGIALGAVLVRYLLVLAPPSIVAMEGVSMNRRVLAFTLAITLGVSLVSGLWPAIRTSRVALALAFRRSNSGSGSLKLGVRRALVAAQAGISFVLIVGALLLVQSVGALRHVATGFDVENRLMVRVSLNTKKYDTDVKRIAYFDEVTDRLRALPGVVEVGATTVLPMSEGGTDFSRPFWREDRGRPQSGPTPIDVRMILPGYVDAMGMRMVNGRNFDDRDRAGSTDVVVINESFARTTWPGEAPVGKRVVLDYRGGTYPYEIVGVVNDTRYYGPRSDARPEVFIPYKQNAYPALFFVIHSSVPSETLIASAREAVRSVDPRLPAQNVATVSSLVDQRMKAERLAAWLFGAMALIALIMSALGVWGVVEYAVGQSTKEIGLRVALGASSRSVLQDVLWRAVGLIGMGIAFGLILLWPLSLGLRSLLFGVSPLDPIAMLGSIVLLLVVALVASASPAINAARLDPATALRAD